MQHIYFNLRALGSCTLFAFSFIEDCHVLFIMATKYGREFVAYRNRFAGHDMARKGQNRFIVYSSGYGAMSFPISNMGHAMARHACYPPKVSLLSNPGSRCPTNGKFKFSRALLQGTVIRCDAQVWRIPGRKWPSHAHVPALSHVKFGSAMVAGCCRRLCSPSLKQNACRPTRVGASCVQVTPRL